MQTCEQRFFFFILGMIGADAKYIDVVFVFVFCFFFCRVEGDIVNEVPGLLWPFTVLGCK